MSSDIEEIKELYFLISRKMAGSLKKTRHLSERERKLLAKYTIYYTLKRPYSNAFLTALFLGAEVDSEGKLLINKPELREKIAGNRAIRFLAAKPEIISPQTMDLKVLFRNVNKVPEKKKKRGPIITGLTARGEKDRLGRWPKLRMM